MAYAYCYRSGEIDIGEWVPSSAISIARGRTKILREKMCALSRHAYDGKTLLVPGIPEADGDDAALDALLAFRDWIKSSCESAGLRVS